MHVQPAAFAAAETDLLAVITAAEATCVERNRLSYELVTLPRNSKLALQLKQNTQAGVLIWGSGAGGGVPPQVWLRRMQAGVLPLLASSLSVNGLTLLHLPGECFIEYQLAAQAARPDRFVSPNSCSTC